MFRPRKDLFSLSQKQSAWKVRSQAKPEPDTRVSSFLSLCLSEREPFFACSVAADKAGPFVWWSHSQSEAGEHLPKHSPTLDLHYPLHCLNRSSQSAPSKQLYTLSETGRMREAAKYFLLRLSFWYSGKSDVHLIASQLVCQSECVVDIKAAMPHIPNTTLIGILWILSAFFNNFTLRHHHLFMYSSYCGRTQRQHYWVCNSSD